MRIAVTGKRGVIGRHLSIGDDLQIDLSRETPCLKGYDVLIHLAQSRRYKDGVDGYEDVWRVNADSTFRLLNQCLKDGVKRFIYASTGSVEYGTDMYSTSKACGEKLVESFSKHLSTLVIRFYCVYGEGQRPDALIPGIERSVREGKTIKNGIKTAPCYAGDAAKAIEAWLQRPEGLVTCSGPEVMTAHDIARVAGEKYGIDPVLEDGFANPVFRYSDFPTQTRLREWLR